MIRLAKIHKEKCLVQVEVLFHPEGGSNGICNRSNLRVVELSQYLQGCQGVKCDKTKNKSAILRIKLSNNNFV